MTITQFLAQSPVPFFSNGQWQATPESVLKVTDPATREVIASVSMATESDANEAVEAAHKAFTVWRDMGVEKRNRIITRLADLVDDHLPVLAELESRDVGKPVAEAEGFDIPFGNQALRYFAGVASETQYEVPLNLSVTDSKIIKVPYGVCGFVFPWNFPFALCLWGIAPALAAGNTVVIKPASETPLSSLYFCKLAEQAGVPAGVINVVVGSGRTVGEAILKHPLVKRTSFTGSTEVGRRVGEISGYNLKPAKLELGGKGAAVIFDDVDVEQVTTDLTGAITMNAGQVCCDATRWYVHESIFDEFVEKVVAKMEQVKLGRGMDEGTGMGPICTEKQLGSILKHIAKGQAAGARILTGGQRAQVEAYPEGLFMQPTLLTGSDDNPCAQEEIFGPVAYLMPFRDEAEVIERANANPYGLSNSVWSADLERADKVACKLVAGNSWINAHNVFEYGLPYGACNQSGCGGGVNSVDTFEDYLRKQSIAAFRQG